MRILVVCCETFLHVLCRRLALSTLTVTCKLSVYSLKHVVLFHHCLNFPQVYCKGAVGAVFVYDVENQFSLLNLGQWRQTLNSLVMQRDKKPIPSIMIGNKVKQYFTILYN